MNYTEKYHLPQWEETDRIMRTDFNQMCADMESGLAGNAQVSEQLTERIEEVEQEAQELAEAGGSSAKAALLQGLFRLAYNHYFHLLDAEKDLWQTGVFTQSFARGAGGKVTGMLQQENMVWIGQYQNTPETDTVTTARKVSTMEETGSTYIFTFTARRGMRVTGIKLTSDDDWTASVANRYTVRLFNQAQNTVDAEFQATLSQTSYKAYLLPVDFVLHCDHYYRIEIIKEKSEFMKLRLSSMTDYLEWTNSSYVEGAATLTATGNEENMGGLVLAHYNGWASAGTLSLNWDGKVMTPDIVRAITDKDGRKMKIAEFRRTSEVPASSAMKLTLTCEERGELELYRMGMILV